MSKRKTYVPCSICGKTDSPSPGNVGTAAVMRCPDCGMPDTLTCRACCPTNHQTTSPDFDEFDSYPYERSDAPDVDARGMCYSDADPGL